MIKFNIFLAKAFKHNRKLKNKLLNTKILKTIKYPNIRIMILDDNLDFSFINDISNKLNLKFSSFKLNNEEIIKDYIIKNADLNGLISEDIIIYQVNARDIKKYASLIKPNYILIGKTSEIINISENETLFKEALIIYNKDNQALNGISYSVNDPSATYFLNNIDYVKERIVINHQYTINITKQENRYLEELMMIFCLYSNIFSVNYIIDALNELNAKKFTYKEKTIFIDIDNMNYNDSVKFISRYNDYKVIVIGWRLSEEDISWLYNVEFERLLNKNIQKIYCVGTNAYDIATRLKYADFNEKNIIVSPNIDLTINEIKNYNLNIYVWADKHYIDLIKEERKK